MSKKKDYNSGVESGLRVAKGLIEKESKAMDYLQSRIDLIVDGHDDMKSAVNRLIEDCDETAINSIFGVCNSIKPADLKDHEKKVLLNILATLQAAKQNDRQRSYVNNLRRHVDLHGYEPEVNYDFRRIEALESVQAIKIIAKAVRIFLFLQDLNMDGIYEHEDDLFSHFEIRSFDETDGMIETIFCLFGEEGLVEIYGYYGVEANCVLEEDIDYNNLENFIIEGDQHHRKYKENLVIEKKNILIKGEIICSNINVYIKNCRIVVGSETETGIIELDLQNSSNYIRIEDSLIECTDSHNILLHNSGFIKLGGLGANGIWFERCIFKNCNKLVDSSLDIILSNCQMCNCYELVSGNSITIQDCVWENDEALAFMNEANPRTRQSESSADEAMLYPAQYCNIVNSRIINRTNTIPKVFKLDFYDCAQLNNSEFQNIKMEKNHERVIIHKCTFNGCEFE